MTSVATPMPLTSTRWNFGPRAAHIFALCSFAITQPLLTALARQSIYLHYQQLGWLEIGVFLITLTIVPPIGLLAADYVVFRSAHSLFRGRGQNSILAMLFCVSSLSMVRPFFSTTWLLKSGFASYLEIGVAVAMTCLFIYLYKVADWFRLWLRVSSLGLLVFPAVFLWQFERIQRADPQNVPGTAIGNPAPVILVVFDEFSGITLLNEDDEIDAVRFPQFARLGNLSTWYRNATTVHPRTDVVIPAILSGRFPETERPALASEYPGNLLQVIESTKSFEMVVFEPISNLCPDSLRHKPPPRRAATEKYLSLLHTVSTVYPRLILTSDTPVDFPAIPKSWFGTSEIQIGQLDDYKKHRTGLFKYPGTEFRERQLEHFLNCLIDSERPRFCFLHTVLPHYPWTFLPTGDQYDSELTAPSYQLGARGELQEDWDNDPATVVRNEFRYRLQVGYVDRFVGQLLDRLEKTDLLNRCLLIVTVDHGVSYRPGHSRRIPDATTLPEILSIPLFIKLPGQTEKRIDDRNIQSVDLLPTIADVLQVKLPEPVDGIPVSQNVRPSRKSFYFLDKMIAVEPNLPQRSSALRRQVEIFGSDPLDRAPRLAASHPEWHGRRIDSFTVDDRTVPAHIRDTQYESTEPYVDIKTTIVPRLIAGRLSSAEFSDVPADVVIVVDGIVCDTSKTWHSSGGQHEFQFVILPAVADGKTEPVEVFAVDSKHPLLRLMRLRAN